VFKVTTAVKKIRAMKTRKKIIPGSSSAGKTIAILIIIIDMCTKRPGLECSVISESVPHLKKGAMKDFLKIMRQTGRFNRNNWHDTDRKYTFSNGAYMEFFSPESVIGSRRNVLYVNEANHIQYADYHQLAIRTSDEIFIDFNPASEFWAHTEVANEENASTVSLTYLDNESRPSNVDEEFGIALRKAEAEEKQGLPITSYWRNWCEVYVHGRLGNLQGVVFNNWEIVPAIPKEAELIAPGMDFGFTNDPTACLKVYRCNGFLYLDELIYEPGLTNPEIVAKFPSVGLLPEETIVADCAEPKSIREIQNLGYSVEAAEKGPDSIRASIDTLQSHKMKVTARSTNLIKELRSYRWKVDKSGKSLNEPVDHSNHLIDALRYVALNKLSSTDQLDVYVM
jgi:phage terminase large subunit